MKARQLLAWNIRRVRVLRGLSQERLAADAAIDRAYLGGLERRTENPTVDLLDRIVEALGVSMAELFVVPEDGDPPPTPLRSGRRKA